MNVTSASWLNMPATEERIPVDDEEGLQILSDLLWGTAWRLVETHDPIVHNTKMVVKYPSVALARGIQLYDEQERMINNG